MTAGDALAIFQGAIVTVTLSLTGILVGVPIGLGLAVLRWADVPVVARIVAVYVSILRATPLVTLLLLGGILKPWGETWQAIWPIAAAVYFSMLLLLPIYILDSFKLSNRLVGPVGRIRNALRDLAEGKPYRTVELRTKDFWPEMGQELDAAVEALTTRRTIEEDDLKLVRS